MVRLTKTGIMQAATTGIISIADRVTGIMKNREDMVVAEENQVGEKERTAVTAIMITKEITEETGIEAREAITVEIPDPIAAEAQDSIAMETPRAVEIFRANEMKDAGEEITTVTDRGAGAVITRNDQKIFD